MAKVITVTSITEETLTSKQGKPYEVVVLAGTTVSANEQYNNQEYTRKISKFGLAANPTLAASIAALAVGEVVTLSFDDTRFKNVTTIEKGATAGTAAPVSSTTTSSVSSGTTDTKKFKLTDESVRLGAMQIAVAERPGTPVDFARVTTLMNVIRTGEGIEVSKTVATVTAKPAADTESPF